MQRWMYFAAAAVVCGLLSTGVMMIYVSLDVGLDTRSTAPAQCLVCPGKHVLQLSDSGLHYVYFEYIANCDSVMYTMDSLPCSTSVTVKDGDVGRVGPINRAQSHVRYSWPERAGVSLLEFEVLKPGDLTMDVSFDTELSRGPLVFAVGPASSMVQWMECGVILFVVSFVLLYSALIFLWRWKIRGRAGQ